MIRYYYQVGHRLFCNLCQQGFDLGRFKAWQKYILMEVVDFQFNTNYVFGKKMV